MSQHPKEIRSRHHLVHAKLIHDHYYIHFPDNPTSRQLVQELPGAKFDHDHQCWLVLDRWYRKIGIALEGVARIQFSKDKKRRSEMEQFDSDVFEGFDWLTISGDVFLIETPYNEQLRLTMRELGAKYDGSIKRWKLPLSDHEALALEVDIIDDLINAALNKDKDSSDELKPHMQTDYGDARFLVPNAARLEDEIVYEGSSYHIESFGKSFQATISTQNTWKTIEVGALVKYAYCSRK